jgi:drug/metabolite transporter (DMT)-like permease
VAKRLAKSEAEGPPEISARRDIGNCAARVGNGVDMTSAAQGQRQHLPTSRGSLTGIAYKVGSVLIFLVMSSLLKASDGVPAGELAFFRSSFAIFPVVAFLGWRGQLRVGVRTRYPFGHFWRGLAGTGGMMFGFFALTKLPLPEAVTINYATPLIIVALSAIFMGEVVRAYRWSAVVAGLCGVIVIAWPRLTLLSAGTTNDAAIGALSALAGCGCAAIAMVQVRRLVQTERSATIVLYISISSTLISLATLPFGWVMPSPPQWAFLIGAGIAGGIAQILLTESYRHAEMSVVAPFEYSSLLFSLAIGYAFFGDVPTVFMLIGGVIVVGSGLFVIYREHRLGLDRERGAVREVVTPQG